jgi:undecaprenyl-diphosphatase
MKKETKKSLYLGIGSLVLFVVWTVLVRSVDRQARGPRRSVVRFATLNGIVHRLFGVHMSLYTVTDWLGLVPIAIIFGFGVLGLAQLIKRRKILDVDRDILALGAFYLSVLAVFLLFEVLVINYRPILIEGALEASYPSSTTMLAMCVMPSAMIQFKKRIKNSVLRQTVLCLCAVFTVFMVIARLISGVHWITDIIGGALISTALVMIYYTYK